MLLHTCGIRLPKPKRNQKGTKKKPKRNQKETRKKDGEN